MTRTILIPSKKRGVGMCNPIILCSLIYVYLCLSVVANSFAAPASPYPAQVKQPDGTEFTMYKKGDERVNWSESADGYPIVRNEETGFWEYAKIDPQHGLINSGIIVDTVGIRHSSFGIRHLSYSDLKGFFPTPPPAPPTPPDSDKQGGQLAPAPPFSQIYANITGTRKVLVILVNFANRTLVASSTEAFWSNTRFFATSGTSVRTYYRECSYNQLDLVPAEEEYGTANNGVVIVTIPYNHPNRDLTWRNSWSRQVARDAIDAANPFVNFASFDTNSNGVITTDELHIVMVIAGFSANIAGSSDPACWPHKWYIDDATVPVVDGVRVGGLPAGGPGGIQGGYSIVGELQGFTTSFTQGTIGVICHELVHDFVRGGEDEGVPDLYDTDNSSYGVGAWCVMGYGSYNGGTTVSTLGSSPAHPCAWYKSYLGWLTPTVITTSVTSLSIPRVWDTTSPDRGVRQLLPNPGGPELGGTGEYFLIENRQRVGYDAALPGGASASGLLIYHIDETQLFNNNDARRLVDLEEADGLNQLDTRTNTGDAGDPYPGSTVNRTFNISSNPNNRLNNGTDSRIGITNISDSGTLMTANIVSTDRPPVLASPGDKQVNKGSNLLFVLSATDPDGDNITYSMTSTPTVTGATFNATSGQFSWTPGYTQADVYVVTFTATGFLLSDSKTITITVNNVDWPPTLTSPGTKTVNEALTLNFTLSATDLDGDIITYSAIGLPQGASLDSTTGIFQWSPDYTQSGNYSVTFVASSNSLSDSKTILIIVYNVDRAPQLTSPGNKNVNEAQLLTFTLSATDPDGDSIVFTMTSTPTATGATMNSSTGVFSWTPDYTQSGIYVVTFTARAGPTPPLSDSKQITITVNNITSGPPLLNSPGDKTVPENATLSFSCVATTPDGINDITYSMVGTTTGATLNATTGLFSWTPNYTQSGDYVVTFTVTSLSWGADSKTIRITVINTDRAPILTSPGNKEISEGAELRFTLSATDPDADSIVYTMTSTPTGATLNSSTGVFSWTPDYTQSGEYLVTFFAISVALSDSKQITITVLDTTLPPSAPSGLIATALSHRRIDLLWRDNSDNEDGFKIERKQGESGQDGGEMSGSSVDYQQIAVVDANVTTYTDTSVLAPSTTYSYRVRGWNSAGGDSDYSEPASAKTFDAPVSKKSDTLIRCGLLGIEPLLALLLLYFLHRSMSARGGLRASP
ncbi:MAG: M6 family metalloprotease domain-containing protein [Planctomycetota bacterium]|nr:M6 family metalloprotease domain-containing protein [Planctomycetota bacterium]